MVGVQVTSFRTLRRYSERELGDKITIEIGRTVIYLKKDNLFIKAYVHHNGRSKEWLTLTDVNGNEIASFHYSKLQPADLVVKLIILLRV